MAYVAQNSWIEQGPRRRSRARGVGMYPDEACYDPTRPGWLPNYFDTWGESMCKLNLLACGSTTCNTAQPGSPGAAASTVQNAGANCAYSGGTFDPSTGICTPGPSFFSGWGPWLLAGGVVAALVLPEILRGGR